MTSSKINGQQLELFAQDFFASLEPAARPVPPAPLFKAQPTQAPALPRVSPPRGGRSAVPPAPPAGPPKRQIQIGPHTLDYELRRSTRRSIGFMIDDSGLRVTAPKRITLAEIDSAIRAKQRWILSKLGERGERREIRGQQKPMEWIDGASFAFLGGEITLRLQPAPRSHCVFDDETRELSIGVAPGVAEWQIQERVRLWLMAEAKRLFAERLDLYAGRLGVSYSALTLSSAGTRWGSCTTEGSIRLNWRLIHFGLPLIDYVVAHELAHLREMNHSARFWATVESIYPDYDGARTALRLRAHELPLLFA